MKIIKSFKIFEKLLLKNYDDYANIIANKYKELPIFDENSVHHWKSLVESNYILWKRLISKVNVIFITGDNKFINNDGNIEILNKNYKIIYFEGGQGYDNQPQMKEDYIINNRLFISIDFSTHPYFTVKENIVFRTVHDFIVHIQGDYHFGLKGELQSYNLHAKLASRNAVPALFTEIVGQVSYHVVENKFPIQKVAVIKGVDYYNVGVIEDYNIVDKKLKNIKTYNEMNLNSFYDAVYYIPELNTTLNTIEINKTLNKYMLENNFESYIFITAHNPHSKKIDMNTNIKSNDELFDDICSYNFLECISSCENYPTENGFLIFDADKEELIYLQHKYKQVAILYGHVNNIPHLLFYNKNQITEDFGAGQSVSGNSTDIISFGQGTPNGMSGTFDKTSAWDNYDSPLQNDVKKIARAMNPDNEMENRFKKKRRIKSFKIHKKVKHLKTN